MSCKSLAEGGQTGRKPDKNVSNFAIRAVVSACLAAVADMRHLSETIVIAVNCESQVALTLSTLLRMELLRLASLGSTIEMLQQQSILKVLYPRHSMPDACSHPASCVEEFMAGDSIVSAAWRVFVSACCSVIAIDCCLSASELLTPALARTKPTTLITCKQPLSHEMPSSWNTVFAGSDCFVASNISTQLHLRLFPVLQAHPFDSSALSTLLKVCDVGILSTRVPDGSRAMQGKPRSSIGCWTVAARAELSLALLRLSSYDPSCIIRIARLLAGNVDGKWSTAVLSADLRWDVTVAFILALSISTGVRVTIKLPECSAVASHSGQSWPASVPIGGSGVLSSSLFPSLASLSQQRDIPLSSPGTVIMDNSLSSVVRSALKCVGMVAMGNVLPHLALYSFSFAFASRALATSAWEWMLLARSAEQCHRLTVAIDAYRRAALLLPDNDRILTRIQLLKDVAAASREASLGCSYSGPEVTAGKTTLNSSKSSLTMLENKVSLSESVIWQLQTWFYDSVGASAWGECGPVPFDITSNAFIANQYAQIAMTLLPETQPSPHLTDRLTVIEMGTGHGKFGFLFLQRLKSLYDTWRGDHKSTEWPSVTYIMTDFTPSNVQLLRNHPCLKPLVNIGVLDFAVFDALTSNTVNLMVSGAPLAPSSRVMIVANYFIDTLPVDAYRVMDGKLHKGLITTQVKWKGSDVTPGQIVPLIGGLDPGNSVGVDALRKLQAALSKTSLLHKCKMAYSWEPVSDKGEAVPVETPCPLDWDALTSNVIHQQASAFRSAGINRSFLNHTAAVKCLERLRKLCCSVTDDSLFIVVVTDKGEPCISNSIADGDAPDPYIAKHGSISVSVNFASLSLAFASCHPNGFCLTPDPPPRNSSISTGVFGIAPENTRLSIGLASSVCMTTISPDGFYSLLDRFDAVTRRLRTETAPDERVDSMLPLEACMSLLKLSHHDPGTFISLAATMQRLCAKTRLCESQSSEIVDAVTSMAMLSYTVNPSDKYDALVEGARLLSILGPQYSGIALELVNQSIQVREELGKLFSRFLLGTVGSTTRYTSKGSASPQARALFVKAHILKALERHAEAAALMEHCAAIHSKYRPVAVAWSGNRVSQSNSDDLIAAVPSVQVSDRIRLLQSRRLYFRKRLDECTREALSRDASSAEGKLAAQEMDLVVKELARLNDELHDLAKQ